MISKHRFSQEIEDALRLVGFERCHEVAKSKMFREFLEDNPIPAGHSYVFTFASGDEFGVESHTDNHPVRLGEIEYYN